MKYLLLTILFPCISYGLIAKEARKLSEKNYITNHANELKECKGIIQVIINEQVKGGYYQAEILEYNACTNRVIQEVVGYYKELGFNVIKPYENANNLIIKW